MRRLTMLGTNLAVSESPLAPPVAIRTVSDVMAARCGDYGVGPVGRHVISDEPARTVGHDNRRFADHGG